ncbi:MAG TPA: HypC/HybG/HupF family hydrogenase formation chaperone [Thermoplasmatales archaeon]|nr:HypC/HybG/HupF family hydrogenase formation chaperone [Thermoplasmatales archaeon]
MCLAVPAKIVALQDKDHAEIDYGDGVRRSVNISLVDAGVGDFVLVHAGFAIQVLEEKEAKETLRLFELMSQGVG